MTKPYKRIPEPKTPYAMGSLTSDQRMLLLAQRQHDSARATLVNSLIRMGRLEEALTIAEDPKQKDLVESLIEAEKKPDTEVCDCKREIDVGDHRGETQIPRIVEIKRYVPTVRHYSAKYGKVIGHNVCAVCGHKNSVPDHIDLNTPKSTPKKNAAKKTK